MGRYDGPPGRETAAARSNERSTWYGYGSRARVEKSGWRLFANDASLIATEVFAGALPVFLSLLYVPPDAPYDPWATAIVAWLTATVVGTAVRVGWIRPPATAARGWVQITAPLAVLRAVYFTPALALAVYGGAYVGAAAGTWLGLASAAVVAAAAVSLFPRVAQSVATRLR